MLGEKGIWLDKENLECHSLNIFEECIRTFDSVEEISEYIEQNYHHFKIGNFILQGLELALERKLGSQHKIGQIISALMDYNLFTADVLVSQFCIVYENAEDTAIDVPNFWELQAHVIVPVLIAENLNFYHFKAACRRVQATVRRKLLIPVLNLLVIEMGTGFVRKVWDTSNVSIKDFLPMEESVDTFIEKNSLEYLTGDAPKYNSSNGHLPVHALLPKGSIKRIKNTTLKATPESSVLLNQNVKLKTVENPWKPTRLVTYADMSEEEGLTQELYKSVRGILNKLTPHKFDTLMKKFMALPINSEQRLKGVNNLIYEKAVDEPHFSKAYANMCKMCSRLEVTKMENGTEQRVNFRKVLITRCQTEFESNKPAVLDTNKWVEEIKNCSDPEKKKYLQLEYEEKERQMRMKSVGNIRFIGELFKLGMLTPAIMYRCIEQLINTPEEESLECLCKLLTTIGKDLDLGSKIYRGAGHPSATLNSCFERMADLLRKEESSKVPWRVRFMLQDVIELRTNKWVPRKEDNEPKVIEPIKSEADVESMEKMMHPNRQVQNKWHSGRQGRNYRTQGNRRSNINSNQHDDGWHYLNNDSRHYYNKFSPGFKDCRQHNFKPKDLISLSLGSGTNFRFQNVAATVKPESGPTFTPNAFKSSAFQPREVETKPPQSSSNWRINRCPAVEMDKERLHMNQRDLKINQFDTRAIDEKNMRLAEEKLESQTIIIFDEYLGDFTSIEEVWKEIKQFYPADKVGSFIQKGLELALERKLGTQQKIGQLISALMDYNLFTSDILVDQLGQIYGNAEDIAIDVPIVWDLQAQLIVPILIAENINFSHFKTACDQVLKTGTAPKLLIPVLNLLVEKKGAGFVKNVWDTSNVSLRDFLPEGENVDTFIKENSLEYLTGDAPNYDSSNNQLPMDQVQDKLLRLMQSSQQYEKILDFISCNVGDKVKDLQFICALTIALCESCIIGSNFCLDVDKFCQYGKLIQRFVDNEDRQLACLDAVHILMSRLQPPQGLVKNIFNLFLEENLISCESFLKWKDNKTEKLENKDVSLLSLTSFFSDLKVASSDGATLDS